MGASRQVLAAQALDVGIMITGYLCSIRYFPPVLVGTVSGDAKARFREGATIHTSAVLDAFESQGILLCQTFTDSVYVVCDWAASYQVFNVNGAVH